MSARILHIILPILLPLLLLSCREEGVDGTVDMVYSEIATFHGNKDGRAEFSFVKVDDTPEITLTADRTVGVEQNRIPARMLISYVARSGRPYESGSITLLGASLINSAPVLTEWRSDYDAWNRDGVYLYSIWRSGKYLNIHVRLTYTIDPRIFSLVADPATLSSPTPELYLVHVLDKPVENHDRAYYASFDLSEVWDRPGVQGVNIHVANTNLDKQIFTFRKTTSE